MGIALEALLHETLTVTTCSQPCEGEPVLYSISTYYESWEGGETERQMVNIFGERVNRDKCFP